MIFVVERGKLTIVLYQYLILVQYSVSYWILVILTETCSPLPTSCCRGRRGQCVIKRHDVSLENFHTKFKTLGTITRTSHYVMNISLFEGFAQSSIDIYRNFASLLPGTAGETTYLFFFPPGCSAVWCHLALFLVGPDSAAGALEKCEYLRRVPLVFQNAWLGHLIDASSWFVPAKFVRVLEDDCSFLYDPL